jgi:hypothetical protein
MSIITDTKGISATLKHEDFGDVCDIALSNKSGQYDYLFGATYKFSRFFRVSSGYDGHEVSIFTGGTFITARDKGKIPLVCNLKLLERTAYADKIPFPEIFYYQKTVSQIITDVFKKYLGFTDAEISITGTNKNEQIEFFQCKNQNVITKLKQMCEAYGMNLDIDSDGYLVVDDLYNSFSSGVSYSDGDIVDYHEEVTAIEEAVSEVTVIGDKRKVEDLIEETECVIGFLPPNGIYFPFLTSAGINYQDGLERAYQFLSNYKWTRYTPGSDTPQRSLLCPMVFSKTSPVVAEVYLFEIKHFKKSILSRLEIKKYDPTSGAESWLGDAAETDYAIDILSTDEDKTIVRVTYAGTNHYAGYANGLICIVLYGYKYMETSSEIAKGYYYGRVGDSALIADLGFVRRKEVTLDWVSSDAQALVAANNVLVLEKYRKNKIVLTIPHNPLLVRGDIITLSDKSISLYVDSVSHRLILLKESEIWKTEVVGYKVENEPWLALGNGTWLSGGSGTWAASIP